jgi:ABC-type Fe3+/spermidine/putrescine transport system ATPase subunit
MRLSSTKTSEGEFKTLEGGHTLRFPIKHDDLAPLNKPVFLAIRPQHVRLSRDVPSSTTNVLSARVRDVVFAGATSTVRVEANGLSLEALVVQPNGFEVGQECEVILAPEHLRLLRSD